MLLQNKFSFFRSFFFTSLFVLSIFIFSPSAEAVGATPPAISYDPYTYENIVPPNGGRSAVNGGKLVHHILSTTTAVKNPSPIVFSPQFVEFISYSMLLGQPRGSKSNQP